MPRDYTRFSVTATVHTLCSFAPCLSCSNRAVWHPVSGASIRHLQPPDRFQFQIQLEPFGYPPVSCVTSTVLCFSSDSAIYSNGLLPVPSIGTELEPWAHPPTRSWLPTCLSDLCSRSCQLLSTTRSLGVVATVHRCNTSPGTRHVVVHDTPAKLLPGCGYQVLAQHVLVLGCTYTTRRPRELESCGT